MRILPSLLSVSLVFGYPAWALEPVNIGICVPLSGHLADRGHKALIGMKIAHRMRPCILGRPVALKIANTHSELANSAVAVFSLVEKHHVAALIGALTSGHTMAGSGYAERRGIPVVAPFATNLKVSQGKQCVFQTCVIDKDQACLAARISRSRIKARTAGLVYDISRESSVDLAACFKKAFVRAGGRITVETRVKTGDRDFIAQINRIKAAKPDAIYAPISSTECALLARQARLMGLHAPMVAAHEAQVPDLIALGGKSVEDLLFTTHVQESSIRTPRGKRFAAICQFHTGEKPLPDQVMAAEAYFILLDAIEQAGSAVPTRIREALASARDCEGMAGEMCIGNDGNAVRPVFVSQVKNGQFVPYEEDD